MKNLFAQILIILTLILIGCEEPTSPTAYRKEVVVSAVLLEGTNVDTVKVNYTGAIDTFYDPDNYAITDAVVLIKGVGFSFYDSLRHDASNPGRYYSIDPLKRIEPTRTYGLEIRLTDGKIVTATTTVPDTFRFTNSTLKNGDTVVYNLFAPLHSFEWSASRYHGTYLPTISSLDSGAAIVRKFFNRDTSDATPPQKVGYRVGLPKDQQNTLLPWLFLNYYGTLQMDVYAADENYTDFLNQLFGGGEIREIRYNINGAIGVFGSMTKAKGGFRIYLKP